VVLVTGATSGIARATAVAFARAGATLVLGGRREDQGRETLGLVREAGARAAIMPGNSTEEADVQRLVESAVEVRGALDCAFNNAGYPACIAPVTDQSLTDLDATFAVNERGLPLCMRYEVEVMSPQAGARS
jgi:NAD(P)-dependent dehydrogenase (short-subunit alcohol dehydrogenase family)